MFKKILGVVVVLLGIFAIVAAMQPDDFRVERSLVINATPEDIFPHANNQRKSMEWSPFMTPDTKMTYEGPEAGVGSVSKWSGKDSGEGISTITESQPNKLVRLKLEFIKPFAATNGSDFTLAPEADKTKVTTKVTWSLYGKRDFFAKAMGLIMNCEQMVGPMFDDGLNRLKKIVEPSKS